MVENFSDGSKVLGFSFDKIFSSLPSCIYWIHIMGELFILMKMNFKLSVLHFL